ncbi:Cytochrome oxidase assembly [Rhizophlyctis rosea]|uniref:Cytochrome c oxidase assembly protein COX16, mitochondrial n=1 Tax=Rhizophlyctis rosea TaxID=64517 RepID=A0AAD5S564_9FUNG|nr:Cytochrome oxidase assembly [Rhizophlyctis rosea]
MSSRLQLPTFLRTLLNPRKKRSHFLTVGLPFVLTITAGSFALSHLAQVRYDYHDQKVKQIEKKELLNKNGTEKQFDIREVYFELTKDKDWDDWDMVRVPRPPGEEQ